MESSNPTVRRILEETGCVGVSRNADILGAAAFGGGVAASKILQENRRLERSASETARHAMHDLGQTMIFLGAMAKNGGEMNGVSAFTAYGAVKQTFDALHKVF